MDKNVLNNNKSNNNKRQEKNGILPRKEFKSRNSVLTDLYEINHIKSLKNCFVAIMILLLTNTFIVDILGTGSIIYGFRYFAIGFGNFDYVIIVWLGMFSSTLSVYLAFNVWAQIRIKLKPKSFLLKLWDRACLFIFLSYFCLFLYIVPIVKGHQLPVASSAVILSEQIRFLMKTHGFIRSNVPVVLSFKPHSDVSNPVPEFNKYLYYLFIPTFVYRNNYPRTKEIRWSFVAINLLEFVTALFLFTFLCGNYLVPDFKNFGLEAHNWRTIAITVSRTILPASLFMLVGFYIILHLWMNIWAELLRFADRLFYMDWWNTETYAAYYRKWNIVVHDYLHTYIYRDMYEIIVPGNKVIATCTVFLISALAHEYIIGFMLGFFFPVMFVQFGTFGMVLSFIKLKDHHFIGNTFLWWSLSFGIGMQFSLYCMEYFARINCPKENETFSDYFTPRLLSCYPK